MEEKKPDLTNFKNIFNYVVYGLAGIVSILYFKGDSAEDSLVKSLEKALEVCQEDNKDYKANNQRLINKAYNLDQINKSKDTMLIKSAQAFDSMAVNNLRLQANPYIKKIEKYTK